MAMVMYSSSSASTSLAPGFRFHPTDEELVFYYLRRKICGKNFLVDAISEIDIYKIEPWDLPGKSRLKTRDMEWYFFSVLDKKYGNSQRTNRATEKGYWKTTGKDREVYHRSNVVGMKKTLVYHCGRAPKGERTNWVMHEYKLIDEKLIKAGFNQDAFVLCRIFQKSGPGPKNGEQYGAPLIEEEWEKEEFELTNMTSAGEVEVGDNDYLDTCDLEQILGTDDTSAAAPLLLELHPGNNGTFVENCTGSTNCIQNIVVNEQPDSQAYEMPYQYNADASPVQQENLFGSGTAPGELDLLLDDESFWDACEKFQYDNAPFIETNDLFYPVPANNVSIDYNIDEFLSFNGGANNGSFENMENYNNVKVGNVTETSKQALAYQKDVNEENHQAISLSKQLLHHDNNNNNVASLEEKEPEKFASDCQYAFLQKASKMLGSIPAPPAFAAEFPAKHAALKLNTLSQSLRPVHVTAGVIQVESYVTDWSVSKDGCYNVILSFGLFRGNVNSVEMESSEKSAAAMSRGWINVALFSVLALSVGFKLGTLVCGW
ncbi:hypothetical protein Leryth_019226 [Lithospermum erythrorhizon]|nr:hypothetical protein Leryth_019226 [Lithospermum erythrorhizon]